MTISRGSLIPDGPPAEYVRRFAAMGFAVTVDDLTGKSRERRLTQYRQVTMTAIRHLCRMSYPAIGVLFDRDHTTVMHACRKIDGGRHHRRGSHERRLWESMDRLCAEVQRQWAIDTGRPFPNPGQMTMGELVENVKAPDLVEFA